jgi:hypothetical protein
METLLRNVAYGYARLFPELLDRFHQNGDLTIVDLIAEKAEKKIESKLIDINKLKNDIAEVLKKGL